MEHQKLWIRLRRISRLYCDEDMLGGRGGDGHQGIKTSIARTSKQSSAGCLVLDQKIEWMKLNKGMIIKSKSMY
jgi:hypothetical protein